MQSRALADVIQWGRVLSLRLHASHAGRPNVVVKFPV